MCILCALHTLLEVVGYHDLSVPSMLVMCFQKNQKVWMGCQLSPVIFWILGIFVTLQSPYIDHRAASNQ